MVHVRTAPDAHGNVVSPTASCFEMGNLQLGLVELALRAETVRAKQAIVAQPANLPMDKDPLGSSSMFFDSESREIQAGMDRSSNEAAAEALDSQIKLCALINRLQGRADSSEGWLHHMNRHGRSRPSFVPPATQPELLSLPKELVGASAAMVQAEARGDLVAVSQHCLQNFCSAFGVPSTLILESRFVGNNSHALRLLNTTVEQMATSLQSALTEAYRRVYGDGTEVLRLRISPLAATQEVVLLTEAGIADAESVQALALRSVGLSPDEVVRAGERLRRRREQTERAALEAAQNAAAQVAAKAAEDELKQKERAKGAGGSQK